MEYYLLTIEKNPHSLSPSLGQYDWPERVKSARKNVVCIAYSVHGIDVPLFLLSSSQNEVII